MTTEKALAALAVAAFMAAAITVLPGFAPEVKASEPTAMAKADRLPVAAGDCAKQDWPRISVECLRQQNANPIATNVRLIATR
jgi:hypothetical protein